jgi:hypothetical protein
MHFGHVAAKRIGRDRNLLSRPGADNPAPGQADVAFV